MSSLTGYPDGYLLYLIKQVELGLRRPFEELVARHGVSLASYTALTVLQTRQGITSSELARRSFVRAQTMAETVGVLIDAGFVRREKDPANGRQMLLYISDLGMQRVSAMSPEVTRLESRVVAGLGADEPSELVRALRSCRDALAEISREERGSA